MAGDAPNTEDALDAVFRAVNGLRARTSHSLANADVLARLAATAGAAPAKARKAEAAPPLPEKVERLTSTRKLTEMVHAAVASPPPAATGAKAERLAELCGAVLACTNCPNLVKSRTQVVFGVGNPEAELMFVGEAPGADEDLAGEPFVGKAGQLLTKIIETMGFSRREVYIANVLKCRPDMPAGESGNRKPTGAEMSTCKPYLLQQIEIIQPKVIIALGATAVEGLLGVEKIGITRERGTWRDFNGVPLMPTFHPAYLLRNQALATKRLVWEDMLAALEKLGRPITPRQQAFFLPKGA